MILIRFLSSLYNYFKKKVIDKNKSIFNNFSAIFDIIEKYITMKNNIKDYEKLL